MLDPKNAVAAVAWLSTIEAEVGTTVKIQKAEVGPTVKIQSDKKSPVVLQGLITTSIRPPAVPKIRAPAVPRRIRPPAVPRKGKRKGLSPPPTHRV